MWNRPSKFFFADAILYPFTFEMGSLVVFVNHEPSRLKCRNCVSKIFKLQGVGLWVQHPLELEGMRKAHIRDGAAVVSYLAWLDTQVSTLLLPPMLLLFGLPVIVQIKYWSCCRTVHCICVKNLIVVWHVSHTYCRCRTCMELQATFQRSRVALLNASVRACFLFSSHYFIVI
jgi:hypothetical protein